MMNKNFKLFLGMSLMLWLSILLFSKWFDVSAASVSGYGYGYSCSNTYWYGNTCISTPNWGTYIQKNLYNTTWTVLWNWNTQLIMTSYGLVSKSTSSTWTEIKLLDLSIYLDRAKQGQNEFGNPRQLKAKKTKAMPNVGAYMTDAYIFAVNITQ